MEADLEIVNQTFVSILSGNFICICTGVFVNVGLALAAERQFSYLKIFRVLADVQTLLCLHN